MAETIRLKHQYPTSIPFRLQYFYDGRAEVRLGVIELPTDKPAWIDRAFILGFRCDPDSGQMLDLAEIRRRANPAVADSTESAGEDVEGTDFGGQPAGEDGLRESELARDESVPEAGVEGSVSDGPKPSASRRRAK